MPKKLTQLEFIDKCNKLYNYKYDYSLVDYTVNSAKVKIICPIHGEFEQRAANHMRGCECRKCKTQQQSNKTRFTTNEFIKKAIKIHGNKYDYSHVKYKNQITPIEIYDNELKIFFWQTPKFHLRGHDGIHRKNINIGKSNLKNTENFIQASKKIHKNKYDYSKVVYKTVKEKITIICPFHGEFIQIPNDHLNGCGCPKCGNQYSSYHEFIKNYLIKNNIKFIENDRSVISPLELDFYLSDYKIAIECNGLRWHGELYNKDKNYHLNKSKLCFKENIQLLHINENEFISNSNIIISKLNSILKINKRKLYARKCQIKEIDVKLKNKFLDKYHLQGSDKSSIKLGLFYHNKLISVMTFCKRRIALGKKTSQDGEYELSRYCGNFHFYVIGGASKLFSHFKKIYNPTKVITYADKRWSNGNLYYNLGFTHTHDSKPNYWYFKNSKHIYHRFNFRKSELNKKLEKFDPNLTEWQNMKNNGWDRIWDCGNMVFENSINNYVI